MSAAKQQFGGDWTAEKLERVRKYLAAYATIMRKPLYIFCASPQEMRKVQRPQ
jgi:hypothetical protein